MLLIAKILIYNPNNEILVLQRSSTHPRYAHHLDFPGGEVEKNETPEIAIARELLEETGIQVEARELSQSAEKQMTDDKKYLLFTAHTDDEASVKLSWEHESYRWLSKKEILEQYLPVKPDDFYLFVMDELHSAN